MSNKEKRAALIAQANAIVNKTGTYTKEDSAKVESLLKLADALNFETPEERSTVDRERESFREYMATGQRRTYSPMSDAVEGAHIVPDQFYQELLASISQYTELLDESTINLISSQKGGNLKLPLIDLASISSSIVAENADSAPVANPTLSSLTLKGYTYRTNPVACSIALEQDSFEAITNLLNTVFSVGFSRGIGADLINGDGSTAPQGLLTSAADSGVTAASTTAFTKAELQAIYFSVNRAYRASPKAAWVMNDDTYNAVLSLKDSTTNRPLIRVTEDSETLFGKRIIISPDMPTDAGSKAVLFGDLGQYNVRILRNGASVRRNLEASGYVEKGVALYTAFLRLDAGLNAPNGAKPVVFAKLAAA